MRVAIKLIFFPPLLQRNQLLRGESLRRRFVSYHNMHAGGRQPSEVVRVEPRRTHVQTLFLFAG